MTKIIVDAALGSVLKATNGFATVRFFADEEQRIIRIVLLCDIEKTNRGGPNAIDEDADGCDALSDRETAARCDRNGIARARSYNITRELNIIGIKPMLAAVMA